NRANERSNGGFRISPQPPVKPAPAPRPAPRPERQATAEAQRPAAPAPAAPPKPPAQRDLARETESLMQKLNGAARELAEAIDNTLPADLEQRYAAGQSH